MSNTFCVLKRNGLKEEVSFDKVTRRIKKLCFGLSEEISPILIAQKVCSQIYNNEVVCMNSTKLNETRQRTIKPTQKNYQSHSSGYQHTNIHTLTN